MLFGLYLKKFFARLFFPVPLILIILLAGYSLVLGSPANSRRHLWGKILLGVGIAVLLLGSVGGPWLIYGFEHCYPPLNPHELPRDHYVLGVAGRGFDNNPAYAPECRFFPGSQLRMHEAARIARVLQAKNYDFTIALGICSPTPTSDKITAVKAFFALYGITPEHLVVVENAYNSRQEILAFQKFPGRLIVISEAFHLPRLMVFARKYGLANALPAPTAIQWDGNSCYLTHIPSGVNLQYACTAVYESLGILEAWLF